MAPPDAAYHPSAPSPLLRFIRRSHGTCRRPTNARRRITISALNRGPVVIRLIPSLLHSLVAAFALLLATAAAAVAAPVELRDITVAPEGNAATIIFLVDGPVRTVVVEPKKNGVAQVRMKSMKAGRGALGSALPKPGVISVKAHIERTDVLVANVTFTRLVTDMRVIRRDSTRIEVYVRLGKATGAAATAAQGRARGGSDDADTKRRWSLSTIVIDPGHGGKDPGAIGIGDVLEKDVTLGVAKRLRDEIRRRMPGVKVVMTRDDDRFVELFRRGQIANESDGRLFISIHCNSMPEKPHPASGFECYILRPGRSEEAARVVAAENAAIRFETDRVKYEAMSAENTIVASMAQSAFVRYSEWLADALRKAMRGRVGMPDRGVHQAGFYVLVGASMPSVLVEIGYLSNEHDVKVLKSSSGQKKIARAIVEGIRAYQKAYSASLE